MAHFASFDTGQQSMTFGYVADWPGNASLADFAETANQNSLLDPEQSAHMATFFQNPDGPMDDDPNIQLNWGEEAGAQELAGGAALFTSDLRAINPAVTLAGSSNGTYHTITNQQTPRSLSHSRPADSFGPNVNESATAEESAASGLLNMVHGRQQISHADLNDVPNSATSWGQLSLHQDHFLIAAPNNHMVHPLNQAVDPYTGQRIQGYGADQMPGGQSSWWNGPMHVQGQPQANYTSIPGQGDARYQTFQGQHMQGTSSPQTPHQGVHHRTQLMTYGSDPHFGAQGYHPPQAWASIEAEKAGNLNGVPLAAQAAAPSHMRITTGNSEQLSKHHSFPTNSSHHYTNITSSSNIGGLPTSQYSARQHGAMAAPSVENGIGGSHFRPTKSNARRTSQADEEDEDYTPNGSKQLGVKRKMKVEHDSDEEANRVIAPIKPTPKRRKSTNAVVASSDEDSDDGFQSDSSGTRKKRNKNRKSVSNTNNNRENLSIEEKRQNHIKSEKQRRDLIKLQYDLLDIMVPGLKGGKSGLSRADIMNEICDYTVATSAANERITAMIAQIESSGAEGYGAPGGEDDAGDSSGDDAPGV